MQPPGRCGATPLYALTRMGLPPVHRAGSPTAARMGTAWTPTWFSSIPDHIGLRSTFKGQVCPLGRIGPTRTHPTSDLFTHADPECFMLFLEPARVLLILCKIIPAQHGVHPLPFWIRLLQLPFKFQFHISFRSPSVDIRLPLIYILDASSWPLLVSFCASFDIQVCVFNDDILLILPDTSDANID
jgi:hypothetical protein